MPERPSQRSLHARMRAKPRPAPDRGSNVSQGRSGRPPRARAITGSGQASEGKPKAHAASVRPRRSDAISSATAPATIKLQKRLAEAGLGSRRAMEELILSGQVSVNGRVAKLGARVASSDRITVAGKSIDRDRTHGTARQPRIVLYHKPEGEIVSRNDPEGRPSVFDRVPIVKRGRWLAVGRLDFNTCGLLIFTDSGELANRLTHPRFQARRDYAVRVVGELNPEQIRNLRTGVKLDDGPARFEVLEAQGGEGTNRWYRVRVREGRNRLVRRLFSAVGVTVSRLMRTSFGPFDLPPRIKRGQWLRLDPTEIKQALAKLENEEKGSPTRVRPARAPRAEQLSAGRGSGEVDRGEAAVRHHQRRRFRAR